MILQYQLKQALTCCFIVALSFCFIGCNTQNKPLPQQTTNVKDDVRQMMDSLVKGLAVNGPKAWLKYFEKDPGFFMASEGQLVFANNDSAVAFINNTLIKKISKIDLQWSNIRIDSLSTNFAGIAANWHEDLTDFANNKISEAGYFTAVAEKTLHGWQLRNAHWSAIKATDNPKP